MKIVCIYKIINSVNNKIYVGSTLDFQKRKGSHLRMLRRKQHHNPKLQQAFNKYKEDSFKFEIIEMCSSEDKLSIEQKYIDTLKPFYNISTSAYCPMLGRKHKKETIERFKNRLVPSGEKHYLYKKTPKDSTKVKMSEIRKKWRWSDEVKKKMSETSKRLGRGVILLTFVEKKKRKIIDSNNNIFNSLVECARFWNISAMTVCDILKGRHSKTRQKVSFKYYEP